MSPSLIAIAGPLTGTTLPLGAPAVSIGRDDGNAIMLSDPAVSPRHCVLDRAGSGLTIRAFCERYDLSQPSFYAWRREIQRRDATSDPFVPVQLVPDEHSTPASLFEVVLPGGPTLRVPPRFDPATLRQLLAILQEGRSC